MIIALNQMAEAQGWSTTWELVISSALGICFGVGIAYTFASVLWKHAYGKAKPRYVIMACIFFAAALVGALVVWLIH